MQTHLSPFQKSWSLLTVLVGSLLVNAGPARNAGDDVEIVRFDTVLELNSSLLHTHTLLFGRYWVGKDHYVIAIVWAEPASTGMNFPVRPMTLIVRSDERLFSVTSQVQPMLAGTFIKPVSAPGPFRHALNAYPITDMRFAEREALRSRIFQSDLQGVDIGVEDTWHAIHLEGPGNAAGMKRSVAEIDVHASGGHLDTLKLLDVNSVLIKSIAYQYSSRNASVFLEREKVLMPERFLTVGYSGRGVTVTIGGKKNTFMEYPALYHQGGRMCSIEYRPLRTQTDLLPMPAGIVVRKADSQDLLHQAQISDYIALSMPRGEVSTAAHRFADFDAKEMDVWRMLERRWLRPPDDVNGTDLEVLVEARAQFEASDPRGMTTGEQLKRINMLLYLDLMQKHPDLARHFQEYLSVLVAKGFRQMVLTGGGNMIETTAHWGYYAQANVLASRWIETSLSVQDPNAILTFADAQVKASGNWLVAQLLEKSLESGGWQDNRLAGQVLRCKALRRLREGILKPESLKNQRARSEAAWVVASVGVDDLTKTLKRGLIAARRTLADLGNLSKKHETLRGQLIEIETSLGDPNTP